MAIIVFLIQPSTGNSNLIRIQNDDVITAIYSPSVDCGDYVIVLNAHKVAVTGRRLDQKNYYRHSGYPGGISSITLREQLERYPTRPLELAVKGMLPKNPLGRQMLKKLKVYAGEEHPHHAQQPIELEI